MAGGAAGCIEEWSCSLAGREALLHQSLATQEGRHLFAWKALDGISQSEII
jgi:hypothetical protein